MWDCGIGIDDIMCDDITCDDLHLVSMAGMDDIICVDLTCDDLNPDLWLRYVEWELVMKIYEEDLVLGNCVTVGLLVFLGYGSFVRKHDYKDHLSVIRR